MPDLAVVTPSFGPDADLFAQLHRSVLEYTSPDTVHHVVVPDEDRGLFERFAGDRCRVWVESQLLPRRYRPVPGTRWYVNARRPWPPARGWVRQQAHKLALAAAMDADAVLVADSDVVLVRPASRHLYTVDGEPAIYRAHDAVHARMGRHIRWHETARVMLGLDMSTSLPLPDYISPLNIWDPPLVRALLDRVSAVSGGPWLDEFCSRLHISEFMLYGVFADSNLNPLPRPATLNPAFCHNFWQVTPLDEAAARRFAEQLPSQALGMMISAKSGTSPEVRAEAIARCVTLTGQA